MVFVIIYQQFRVFPNNTSLFSVANDTSATFENLMIFILPVNGLINGKCDLTQSYLTKPSFNFQKQSCNQNFTPKTSRINHGWNNAKKNEKLCLNTSNLSHVSNFDGTILKSTMDLKFW